MIAVFMSLVFLVVFAFDYLKNWRTVTIVLLLIPNLIIIASLLLFLEETPFYLVRKGTAHAV